MDTTLLRMRMVSFKDPKRQSVNDTIFYVKKLTEIQPNPGEITQLNTERERDDRFFQIDVLDSPMILEQNNPASSVVLSCNETFDWYIEEGNYCQILFLTSEARSKPKADIILRFNNLVKTLHDRRYFEQSEPELICDVLSFNLSLSSDLQLIRVLLGPIGTKLSI